MRIVVSVRKIATVLQLSVHVVLVTCDPSAVQVVRRRQGPLPIGGVRRNADQDVIAGALPGDDPLPHGDFPPRLHQERFHIFTMVCSLGACAGTPIAAAASWRR